MLLDLLFAAVGAVWLAVAARVLLGSRALPDLGAEPSAPGEIPPRVAVVVAARDAAHELEGTLAALFAQRDVDLQVVVVDDRSADATPALLAAHAAREPRLTVERVDSLPEGWLGKVHACHRGVARAGDREWLLFVDADTDLAPDVVARAVRTARRLGVPHLSLAPGLVGQTALGRALLVTLSMGLFLRALDVARGDAERPFGVGAFSLIRQDVYRAIGGHDALRLQVVEDCALAGNVLRAGHRSALRMAVDDFRVRWVTDVPSAFRVLEKNFFALFRFRTLPAVAVVAGEFAAWALPLAGALRGGVTGWFAAAGYLALVPVGAVLARRYRAPWWLGFAVPVLFPLVPAILLRSVVATLRRGGVRWRETFYPLAVLRGG